MNEAGQLKERPVVTGEMRGNDRALSLGNQAVHSLCPRRINDRPLSEIQTGHLAGRKDDKEPTIGQPTMGPSQPDQAAARRLLAFKWINQEEELPQFRNPSQHEIGENTNIGAQGQQQMCQSESFDPTEWMVCHDDARTLPRHFVETVAYDIDPDPELFKDPFQKDRDRFTFGKLEVLPVQLFQSEHTFQRRSPEEIQRRPLLPEIEDRLSSHTHWNLPPMLRR